MSRTLVNGALLVGAPFVQGGRAARAQAMDASGIPAASEPGH